MNPKVSIIIPVYNAENYIIQCLESALNQTEQNIEIIVIDDASTDQTLNLVENYTDPRLKIIKNEVNRGAGYCRNQGIKAAQGDWIVPLDSDDWYAPERIEKLWQVAQTEKADLVADDLYFIQDEKYDPNVTLFSVARAEFSQPRKIDILTFIDLNRKPGKISPHLGLTKPLIKRSFLVQNSLAYEDKVTPIEDFLLYTLCLLKGARFVVIPEAYYYYRRSRPGSASTFRKVKILNQFCAVNRYLLEQDSVQSNPALKTLVNQYLKEVQQEKDYYTIIQPLKEQGCWKTFLKTLSNFKLLTLTLKQIPYILKRRFSNV
ncbi:glycosyltransferase [Spirulina subsalsa FACHB-351]|uniref:Glycosyltransferase n=1 Tax=Spirulina subsalsa FACHB-351 TaxID=234711 RepID=A0ABT3L554_9CYAN|nr:glycosyltransferase family 2 protein [Spirulina subsalsa]MCW6036634.1 glycosyltransferase [Spirulina subsalsa FACHB-351]